LEIRELHLAGLRVYSQGQGRCNYTLRQRLLLPNLLVFSVAVAWDGSSVSGDLVSLVFLVRCCRQLVVGRERLQCYAAAVVLLPPWGPSCGFDVWSATFVLLVAPVCNQPWVML
jgi:hypothetical protein